MRKNGILIRLGDVLYEIAKHRIAIIALTAAGLLIGIALSGISHLRGEISRRYRITCSFSVNTQTNSGLFPSGHDFPNYNDIHMAEDMVGAVPYVFKSDKMLNEVIRSLGLQGITAEDIADNLTLKQYNETQIIEMSLYWRGSEEGISILSEINRTAPTILKDTLGIGGVSVINEPSARYLLGGGLNIRLWGYMALLGFCLGIGICLLERIVRPTLLNAQDMETVFDLEVLEEIGENKAYFDKGSAIFREDDPDSEAGERFASAAHIIRGRLGDTDGPHILFITSAQRNEGKTSLLANLAIHLSKLEKRVLLVDFDVKNPTLGRLFLERVGYGHSLNALYAGDISEKEAVTKLTDWLDILPAIPEEGNAVALDSRLLSLVRALAGKYDYVLMDTSPVGLTADPMGLSRIASSALFVVRCDTASMAEIRDALKRIEKSGVRDLGCIVNGVRTGGRAVRGKTRRGGKI